MSEPIFDQDIPLETLSRLLEDFVSPDEAADIFFALREQEDITDVKRGELYPEVLGWALRLRRVLARVYGVDPVQAQPNFGCNGCIDTLLTFVRHLELSGYHRNGFMAATPTYFRYYHKVQALGMKFFGVPFETGYRYPVERVLAEIRARRPSCLFLVSPNNPTGVPIPDEELYALLDAVPDDLYVAVDRTCANTDQELPTRALLERYPHKKLLVFHSFSKYYGMSHLRIGFAIVADMETAEGLNRHLPFGLNLEALLRANYLLMTQGELRPDPTVLQNIRDSQAIMRDFLARHPDYSCTDFKSNYALLFLPPALDSTALTRHLMTQRILVMPGLELPEPDARYIRIHVGGKLVLLERLLRAIEKWQPS
jgi:histidinol-phosphate/aromatic aminotransferase/cobyric acid decarboxylase-like protein